MQSWIVQFLREGAARRDFKGSALATSRRVSCSCAGSPRGCMLNIPVADVVTEDDEGVLFLRAAWLCLRRPITIDADAIAEGCSGRRCVFVPIKTEEQLELPSTNSLVVQRVRFPAVRPLVDSLLRGACNQSGLQSPQAASAATTSAFLQVS